MIWVHWFFILLSSAYVHSNHSMKISHDHTDHTSGHTTYVNFELPRQLKDAADFKLYKTETLSIK
jgi:hypothetical protein